MRIVPKSGAPPSSWRSSRASLSMPPTGQRDVNSGHSMLMEYSRSGYGIDVQCLASAAVGSHPRQEGAGASATRERLEIECDCERQRAVMLALAQSMHAFNIANGPVHSAPAIAAARTAWRHPPPGT